MLIKLKYKRTGQGLYRLEALMIEPEATAWSFFWSKGERRENVQFARYVCAGFVWDEPSDRLEALAAACSYINGRKNVRSVEADEGILY